MERKVDTELNELFEKAVSYFQIPIREEAYKMFQKVIEKDPKFITKIADYDDNPYYYMGSIHYF